MNTFKSVVFFISIFFNVHAQQTITLEQSIALALENNRLVQVADLEREIAAKDVTLGHAGFMPTLNLVAGHTLASNNVHQQLFNGTLIERSGARQNNYNGSLVFNWILFEGLRKNYMYDRLQRAYDRANYQTKIQMESTIMEVSIAYLELLYQQEVKETYENTLHLYQERLRLAEAKYNNGLGAKADVLLTKVDINSQLSLLLRHNTAMTKARYALNRQVSKDLSVHYTIAPDKRRPSYDSTLAFSAHNNALAATKVDIAISKNYTKEIRALYYPRINFITAYTFTQIQSQAGQLLLNRNGGPSIGLGLNWALFEGFNKSRLKNAYKLRTKIATLIHEDTQLDQASAYQSAMAQYKNALHIIALETASLALVEESYTLYQQRYVNGSISLFEYKEAQKVLEDAKLRLANARYEALSAELTLKRLNGMLLQ